MEHKSPPKDKNPAPIFAAQNEGQNHRAAPVAAPSSIEGIQIVYPEPIDTGYEADSDTDGSSDDKDDDDDGEEEQDEEV
ncbi:histone deacetylase HDT3-like [Drosophila pseudoobscura]|uniref:Histone deacetylase HDT3-like n=1 Tax=Drosophila pseudoobscura pseudoobscura TaxID=46245 RepID=A0A6I8UZI5_DROPS|nr:histone deacetylase HDT3 [Drosophila pseudoobscura]